LEEYEAEIILDYIERFNELFEHKKYEEAAYFASAGPKNILRNIETLYRFKSVSNQQTFNDKTEDPLLIYCNAVLDSISDDFSKPNNEMSIEAIKIALKYNLLDVITRWISQER
jgi:hypothetical protein